MGGNSSKPSIISYEEAVKRSKFRQILTFVVVGSKENQNTAKKTHRNFHTVFDAFHRLWPNFLCLETTIFAAFVRSDLAPAIVRSVIRFRSSQPPTHRHTLKCEEINIEKKTSVAVGFAISPSFLLANMCRLMRQWKRHRICIITNLSLDSRDSDRWELNELP